jgi:hypothetical protein
MTTVMESIAPIRTDGTKLWKLLFQLSFSDDSPASMAVLRAMLSLASLYRYGHGEEALTLKVAAIKSLRASMDGRVTGTTEIYQHTAVGMLLCAFEVCRLPISAWAQLMTLGIHPVREFIPMAIIRFWCQNYASSYLRWWTFQVNGG